MFNPFRIPRPQKTIIEMTDDEWQEFLCARIEYKKKLDNATRAVSLYAIAVSTLSILWAIFRTI